MTTNDEVRKMIRDDFYAFAIRILFYAFIIFLVASFTTLSFNVATWSMTVRAICGIIFTIIFFS